MRGPTVSEQKKSAWPGMNCRKPTLAMPLGIEDNKKLDSGATGWEER